MSGAQWPHSRVPDVADLRTRECWICKEDETFQSRAIRKKESPSAWIHPCKCTLIAHESCLLEWIARTQQTLDPPPACPQCKTSFMISSKRSWMLDVLDWLDQRRNVVVRWTVVTGVTGSFLILCTLYGAFAIRLAVGKEMSRLILGDGPSKWPIEAWINLPFVPLALLISQTSYVDRYLLSLPFVATIYSWNLTGSRVARADFQITFPPSPPLLLAVFPIVKFFYSTLRQGVIHMLMDQKPTRPRDRLQPADIDGGPELREREAFGLRVQLEEQNGNQQNWARGVVLNGTSLGQWITYSLSLPVIAWGTGHILRFVANFSPRLHAFLGLRTPTSTARPFWRAMLQPSSTTGLGLQTGRKTLEEMDPVWWRNTVGLCLFIVTKDSLELLHAWLRREERRSRRIVSRDFAGVDLQGLDLII